MPDMLEKLRADVEAALTYDGEDSLVAVDRAALAVIDEFCAGLEVVEVNEWDEPKPYSPWWTPVANGVLAMEESSEPGRITTIFVPRKKEPTLLEAAEVAWGAMRDVERSFFRGQSDFGSATDALAAAIKTSKESGG